MKKIFFLTLFLFTVAFFSSQSVQAQTEAQRLELCTKLAGETTYLSDYPFQLAAAKDGEREPVFRQALALKKGNRYRLTICTDEESAGEAVLKLFDEAKMMGSSFNPETGKDYQNFDFDCSKTAIYIIMISVKEAKDGSGVALLSHVKTL